MTVRRVLITGSRSWDNEETIANELNAWIATVPSPTDTLILVSGACPSGADSIAERIWTNLGHQVERHPANWSQGRGAGPARNQAMVNAGADTCLAFIGPCDNLRCTTLTPHNSHGATDCARRAIHAGIVTKTIPAVPNSERNSQ